MQKMPGLHLVGCFLCFGLHVVLAENIALGKPAGQPADVLRLTADKAVDGYRHEPYCAHPFRPIGGGAQWWVDLLDSYMVEQITLFNTESSEHPQMTHFILSVGYSLTDLHDCGPVYPAAVPPKMSATVNCSLIGRFVHLRRVSGRNPNRITICEVEVTGHKLYDCSLCPADVACTAEDGCERCAPGTIARSCARENFALGKSAHQTGEYGGHPASEGNDGRYSEPFCAQPNNPTRRGAEWWVDLGATYQVEDIVLYNTYDLHGRNYMNNFGISVGATLSDLNACEQSSTQVEGHVTISCNIQGRFVQFGRVGGTETYFVILCELEVFGRRIYDCDLCLPGAKCSADNGCDQCPADKFPPGCDDMPPTTMATETSLYKTPSQNEQPTLEHTETSSDPDEVRCAVDYVVVALAAVAVIAIISAIVPVVTLILFYRRSQKQIKDGERRLEELRMSERNDAEKNIRSTTSMQHAEDVRDPQRLPELPKSYTSLTKGPRTHNEDGTYDEIN